MRVTGLIVKLSARCGAVGEQHSMRTDMTLNQSHYKCCDPGVEVQPQSWSAWLGLCGLTSIVHLQSAHFNFILKFSVSQRSQHHLGQLA